MSLWAPYMRDWNNGPDETELKIAETELKEWWARLSKYEKEGLKQLVIQLGKQLELDDKKLEYEKAQKELNQFEKFPEITISPKGGDKNV